MAERQGGWADSEGLRHALDSGLYLRQVVCDDRNRGTLQIATSSDAAGTISQPAVDDRAKATGLMDLLTHIVLVPHDQMVVDD